MVMNTAFYLLKQRHEAIRDHRIPRDPLWTVRNLQTMLQSLYMRRYFSGKRSTLREFQSTTSAVGKSLMRFSAVFESASTNEKAMLMVDVENRMQAMARTDRNGWTPSLYRVEMEFNRPSAGEFMASVYLYAGIHGFPFLRVPVRHDPEDPAPRFQVYLVNQPGAQERPGWIVEITVLDSKPSEAWGLMMYQRVVRLLAVICGETTTAATRKQVMQYLPCEGLKYEVRATRYQISTYHELSSGTVFSLGDTTLVPDRVDPALDGHVVPGGRMVFARGGNENTGQSLRSDVLFTVSSIASNDDDVY